MGKTVKSQKKVKQAPGRTARAATNGTARVPREPLAADNLTREVPNRYARASASPVRAILGSAVASPEDAVLTITDRPEFALSPFEKMGLIEKGIPKNALESLKEKAELDYDQLAKVLNVARATLISKKGEEKFNQDVSDKILGLADVYSYGYEVFEDRDQFNQWVFNPNKALGGQAPFDILHHSFGREEVKNLIGRIDYGIYS